MVWDGMMDDEPADVATPSGYAAVRDNPVTRPAPARRQRGSKFDAWASANEATLDALRSNAAGNRFLGEMNNLIQRKVILTPRQLAATERILQQRITPPPDDGSGLSTSGVTVGVYQHDHVIYVVKPNRKGTHSYANKMVFRPDGRFSYQLDYEPGAMKILDQSERLTADQLDPVLQAYGRCIMCGHALTDAARGPRLMGDVCAGHLGYPVS